MGSQEKQPLVITISGDRSIHDVAADLRAAGFDVEQVLDQIGSVTGSGNLQDVDRLRRIPGVADVSHDYPVDIGPPGAEIS